jgi:hypothetical protein
MRSYEDEAMGCDFICPHCQAENIGYVKGKFPDNPWQAMSYDRFKCCEHPIALHAVYHKDPMYFMYYAVTKRGEKLMIDDDKSYTLREAMHLALDGAKVCHDDMCGYEYMAFGTTRFTITEFDGELHNMTLDIIKMLPQSGWRIYKEPVITYKGAKIVIDAVFAGQKLLCKTGKNKYSLELMDGDIVCHSTLDSMAMPCELINNATWTEKLDE